MHIRLLLLLLALLLSGGAHAISDLALSSLAQKGKHHELIEALAPAVREGGKLSSFQLMMLGGAYYETGQYRRALETADLLEARIRSGDSTVFGADLAVYPTIIRGAVALDQGLFAEALRQGSLAEGQLKPNQFFFDSQRIMISSMLGVAHALTGNVGEARRHLELIRPIGTFMNNLGPEKFTALARIQIALRDYAGALASIADPAAAVSPLLTAFYDPTFQNVPRFFMRSKSLLETGQVEEARRGYDNLLAHPQIGQFGTLYWTVLFDRARIAIIDNDLPAAIDLLRRAVEVIEQRRASITTDAGRIGFVGDKQAVYGRLIALLLQQGEEARAFDYVERAKSRALVDLLATKSDFAARDADPERLRQTLAELDALDRAAQEKRAQSTGAENPGLRSLAVVRQQLAEASPQLATLVSVGSAPLSELSGLLPADEALVEYYTSGTDAYAFVLRNGNLRAVTLAKESRDGDIQALRAAIEQPDDAAWQPVAERLHARLWRPLETLVAGSGHITLVAHGAMHYLPFAILRDADGSLLIDRHAMRILPSASVLRFLPPQATRGGGMLLALGDPDLGDPSLDLKFAAEEARAVAQINAGARLLLRQDASETNFRKASGAFQRLHIASHGSFRADAPLDSGLHLAKDETNDGMLSVGEIYSLNLDADLVALSACETGLGRIASGDDVVGLGRGFLYAGARSIVSSLWSVDDKATGVLMQSFYRNLGTHNKVDALRMAQMETRKQFPHPFFWAAFQLTGRGD